MLPADVDGRRAGGDRETTDSRCGAAHLGNGNDSPSMIRVFDRCLPCTLGTPVVACRCTCHLPRGISMDTPPSRHHRWQVNKSLRTTRQTSCPHSFPIEPRRKEQTKSTHRETCLVAIRTQAPSVHARRRGREPRGLPRHFGHLLAPRSGNRLATASPEKPPSL